MHEMTGPLAEPIGIDALMAQAKAAEAAQDWSEAIDLWTQVVATAPSTLMGQIGLVRSMCGARRFAAAEALLVRAMADFPGDSRLATYSAVVATATGAWEVAARRWRQVLALEPNHPAAAARIVHCDQQIQHNAMLDPAMRVMFDRFTSLGRNCEFGLLQKAFDSEQVSLLRWAQTRPQNLLNALRGRFAGLGDTQWTDIYIQKRQFLLRDRQYGIGFHTFIDESEAPQDDVYRKQCRRVRMLRDKLLQELGGGRRILVYQNVELPDAQVEAIHDALQDYAPNVLLAVREARQGEVPGTFRTLRPGLLLGVISHEGLRPDGTWNICTRQWQTLCQAAYERWGMADLDAVAR